MKEQGKKVKYIQMDITYFGKCFPKTKYYSAKEDGVYSHSLRTDDGF